MKEFHMQRHGRHFATWISLLAVAGCAATTPNNAERLANTAWVAETIDGKPATAARSTLRFFDRQFAGGSLGCNPYSTTYFADADGLRFGGIAPTNNTCTPAEMEQEARFSAALQATRNARHEADAALLLMDADGKARVKLAPLKP
jgi:heat shock protein HslJ